MNKEGAGYDADLTSQSYDGLADPALAKGGGGAFLVMTMIFTAMQMGQQGLLGAASLAAYAGVSEFLLGNSPNVVKVPMGAAAAFGVAVAGIVGGAVIAPKMLNAACRSTVRLLRLG
jgi:hypothetical protein